MKIKNLNFIIVISIIILIFPVSLYSFAIGSINPNLVTNYTTMGSDLYVEDFTSTAYRNGISTASGWGAGAISSTRNFTTTLLDHYPTAYAITDIDIQGRKAYASIYDTALGIDSLTIFDINEPASISKLGGNPDWTYTLAVEANGDYLYAGQLTMVGPAVVVFDILDPTNPTDPNGMGFLDGLVTDIEIDGHLVYFLNYNATSGQSLKILYAEDPLNLQLIVCDWNVNQGLGLEVQGTTAYVAAGEEGFYVLNTTDKYTPVELDHLALPGNCTDVIVDGDVAYVVAGYEGLYTIDISDPTNIAIMSNTFIPGESIDLVKQGNTLFVAGGSGGAFVLDVVNPNNPIILNQIMLPYAYCVDLYGGVLVVGTGGGLYTYSICAGIGITNIANHVFSNPYNVLEAWDVRVQDDVAIVAGGPDGIYTLDVSDPENPILLDQDIAGFTPAYRKLDVRGDYAYVADYGNAFRVYYIGDPSNIIETDNRGLSQASDVKVHGDMAYIADGSAGVFIYNISDPYNVPGPYSSFDIFTNVTSVDVQGNYLYVVDNIPLAPVVNSFYIYDISVIAAEVLIGANAIDAQFQDVFVDGDYAYAADTDWMLPYDIHDPVNPVWVTYTNYDSNGVWGFGPYCLSADTIDGVSLSNCTNLVYMSDPTISRYTGATGAKQVTTSGDYTYVANTSSLVILRHFASAGDTFQTGSAFALSTEVDSLAAGEIKSATLQPIEHLPPGTSVDYYMSADGGAHWEPVIPGVEHEFITTGDDLRWEADFFGPTYRSAYVYQISIEYTFNEAPSIPTIADLGDKAFGVFKVDWDDSTDDVAVDHYILQMSDTLGFIDIPKEWTATKSSQTVMLGKGDFYFRVQAVDDEGFPSAWSIVKAATTKMSTTILGVIAGGGLVVVILAILIPVILVRRKKKKTTPTR